MTASPDAYTGIDNLDAMREAERYNRWLLRQILDHAPPNASLLDFGAGAGTFCVPLHQQGLDIRCVEPDATLGAALRAQGLQVLGSAGDLAPGSLDYIYSLNVLEHIENDLAALRELHAALRPGGRLLIYVPAFQLLYSSMDRKVGHFRRYRRAALCARLREAGFILDDARYVDSLGFFAALAYRFVGSDNGDLNAGSLRFYDRWIWPPSRALDRLLDRLLGKNLLAVAHRPAP